MKANTLNVLRWSRLLMGIGFAVIGIITLSGCGEADYSNDNYRGNETGNISFHVVWEGTPADDSSRHTARALNCVNAGISIVSFEVFDSNNNLIAVETFECALGHGTVNNVPVGLNRKLD